MSKSILDKLAAWRSRERAVTLCQRLRDLLRQQPRCPEAHYLLGCACFDRQQVACGVRHLMTAHHLDPRLESAALLVFAGLNWARRPEQRLLAVVLETWHEFRQPPFDRRRCERRLLDALADHTGPPAHASPLARRLWRLPIQTLREQLSQAVAAATVDVIDPRLASLLTC